MNILAFDTTSKLLSIVLQTESGLFEHFLFQGFKHSENLVREIQSILETAEIRPEEIDLIVCPEGPGSFTGLRIGLSTAKGLSFALEKPFITVPTLDMLASGNEFFDGTVLPVLDARKNRFYTALYKKGKRVSDYLDIAPEFLMEKLSDEKRVLITGADADIFHNLSGKKFLLDPDFRKGYARYLLSPGKALYEEKGPSPETIGPLYLRKSEAEIGITR